MFHLLAFCVLFLSVSASADDQIAVSSPPSPCNINNYNSFFAGPNKKVENLLTEMKKQLDELQRQVELLTKHQSTKDPCPSGWTQFDDFCYLVSSSIKPWSQAQAYCRSLGADLVKINSAEENQFVVNLVRRQAPSLKQVWIGLTWNSTTFFWSDHSVPVFKNWAPGEPNTGAGEPCGHMYIAPARPYRPTGSWNDVACHVRSDWPNGIVCQKLA